MLTLGFARLHGGRSAAGSSLRRRRVRADAARLAVPVAARVGWREIDGGWFPGTVVSAAVGGPAKKKVAKATHIVEFKKKEGGAQGHGG